MRTMQIPREQWVPFLDGFSREHEGWIATLEVVGRDIGDQEQATGLPLVGISADTKDGENRIDIMIGGRPERHVTHIVEKPRRVWIEKAEVPAEEPVLDAVAIEDEDGRTTILRFQYVPADEIERQLPPK